MLNHKLSAPKWIYITKMNGKWGQKRRGILSPPPAEQEPHGWQGRSEEGGGVCSGILLIGKKLLHLGGI